MCGVSTQTVSRVINKRPDVSPAHACRPSRPRSRRSGSSRAPSLAAWSSAARRRSASSRPDSATSASPRRSTASPRSARASGYALLLKELASSDAVEMLSGHRVPDRPPGRGRSSSPPRTSAPTSPQVRERLPAGSPPIIFLKSEPSSDFPTISIDNYGGARRGNRAPARAGRRKIGHIGGPPSWHEAEDRHDGWRDALRDAGLEPGPVASRRTGRRPAARPRSTSC